MSGLGHFAWHRQGVTQAPARPTRPRARPSVASSRRPPRPVLPWRRAGLLALRTAALGLLSVEVVVLILWATEQGSTAGAGGALHTGVAVWLIAHHSGLTVAGSHLGVTPYGLTLLPAVLLWRGGARASSELDLQGRGPVLRFAGVVAGAYAVLTALLCLLARQTGLSADPAEAFVGAGALAFIASGYGSLRAQSWRPSVPARVADVVRGALVAGLLVITAASGLALLALVTHHGGVTSTGHAVAPSTSGTLGLGLLDVLAVPTVMVDGASALAGPGFAIGAHTSVGLGGVSLGPVPALPVLGALPSSGTYPALVYALVLIPLGAGIIGGLRATRGISGWRELCMRAAALGATTGVGFAALSALVGGPAGPGRLSVTGPSPWEVGLAVFGEVGGGALMVSLVKSVREWRAAT